MLIRPAEPEDAEAIGTVWQRAALIGYEGIFPDDAPKPTPELLAEQSRRSISAQGRGRIVLVACDAGPDRNVVGTVSVVADPYEGTRAHVQRLYVDPGYWGRGIGRLLHDRALTHLRRAGYRVAMLWVLEENLRARAAYERWGWQPTQGRHTEYPGIDEVCYLLML